MIRSSYDHDVFSWTYKAFKYILETETGDILMSTHNMICFENKALQYQPYPMNTWNQN